MDTRATTVTPLKSLLTLGPEGAHGDHLRHLWDFAQGTIACPLPTGTPSYITPPRSYDRGRQMTLPARRDWHGS
eukprot:6872305-Pyramimonas_sp.AAC.1